MKSGWNSLISSTQDFSFGFRDNSFIFPFPRRRWVVKQQGSFSFSWWPCVPWRWRHIQFIVLWFLLLYSFGERVSWNRRKYSTLKVFASVVIDLLTSWKSSVWIINLHQNLTHKFSHHCMKVAKRKKEKRKKNGKKSRHSSAEANPEI